VADPPRVRNGNFPFGGNSSLYPTFFIASQEKFINGGIHLVRNDSGLIQRSPASSSSSGGRLPSPVGLQSDPALQEQMTLIQHDTVAPITALYGWQYVSIALAVTCLLTALMALMLAVTQHREAQVRLKLAAKG
jgi:hypothetical protein